MPAPVQPIRVNPRSGKPVITAIILLLIVAALLIHFSRPGSVAVGSLAHELPNDLVSRDEVISIARTYADHHWQATLKNVRHGIDALGIEIQTPNASEKKPSAGWWGIGADNIGLPYKWGGFDTPQSFDAGIRAGKAAGDVYSASKRQHGNAAVSSEAVGIDCSGFISRCWKLPGKYGTATIPGLCSELKSAEDLQPGDIMDAPHGHVVLFARWLDNAKSRALFYEAEAEPQPRVVASEHQILWLRLCGARPYRYLHIQD